ncbi:hypothetical protein FKM82_016868 [Ascaphus truei]
MVVGGDFNMALNPLEDKSSLVNRPHAKASQRLGKKFKEIMGEYSLLDIWRTQHRGQRDYVFLLTTPDLLSNILSLRY